MSDNTLCLAPCAPPIKGRRAIRVLQQTASFQCTIVNCELPESRCRRLNGPDSLTARSVFSSLVSLRTRSCAPATNERDQNATALCLAL